MIARTDLDHYAEEDYAEALLALKALSKNHLRKRLHDWARGRVRLFPPDVVVYVALRVNNHTRYLGAEITDDYLDAIVRHRLNRIQNWQQEQRQQTLLGRGAASPIYIDIHKGD